MLYLQSVILGIVQGLTEFIPVSSSAHLVILPWLFNWQSKALSGLAFDVSLHFGTLLAVLAYFAKDWVTYIKAGFRSVRERRIGADPDRRMAWYIVIGCVPGGLAGLLFEGAIERLFHGSAITASAMVWLGAILAAMGLVLFLSDRLARHARPLSGISLRDAALIGTAQAMAIFPGVSRSGATITAALALGYTREAAARFSFLLAAPLIAGASAKSGLDLWRQWQAGTLTADELSLVPIGVLAAAVSGFFCIKFLLAFLQKHSTTPFAWYRWALGALVIVVALAR